MQNRTHIVKTKVWLYEGKSAWHFATIPPEKADGIRKDYIWPRRGFGAIPVHVTIGATTWKTSIFPDKNKAYLLPLKKDVRRKEQIQSGDSITIELRVEI